jgi:hypothetical protein
MDTSYVIIYYREFIICVVASVNGWGPFVLIEGFLTSQLDTIL